MGYVIDTTLLIAAERGYVDIKTNVKKHFNSPCFLSVIGVSELLHGVRRADDPAIRAHRSAFVEEILQKLPILPIDVATARIHAQLWADLAAKGVMIGAHDAWIAASCLAHGHTVITANIREFDRVPGLSVENW